MLVDMRVEGLPLAFCNRAAEELTGYQRSEMIGRNCKFMQGKLAQQTARGTSKGEKGEKGATAGVSGVGTNPELEEV